MFEVRAITAGSAEGRLKDSKSSPRLVTETPVQAESPNISLSSRLSAYRTLSGNRRPDFAKAYGELVERLSVIDRGQLGPTKKPTVLLSADIRPPDMKPDERM